MTTQPTDDELARARKHVESGDFTPQDYARSRVMDDQTSTAGNIVSQRCQWCAGYHIGTCSLVKAIEYYPDGTIKRVEFRAPQQVHALEKTMAALRARGMTGGES
jgi:hypothetical protein